MSSPTLAESLAVVLPSPSTTLPSPDVALDASRDTQSSTPATAVPNPRWYADPSKLAGVLGFVLALATVGERLWVRDQEIVSTQLQQLRDTAVALADVQAEYLDAVARAPTNLYALGVAKNTKRQMYLQTAAALLGRKAVRQQARAQLLAALASELMIDGRYVESRQYFLDALAAPGADDATKPFLLRSLGQLHLMPNSGFTNIARSRQYFQDALAVFERRKDDTGHLSWAETTLMEAGLELLFGDRSRAQALARTAKMRLLQCRSNSLNRIQLEGMASSIERGEQPTAIPDAALNQGHAAAATTVSSTPATRTADAPPTSNQPSVKTTRGIDARRTVLEVWPAVPGQNSGVEMDVAIDGRPVGRVSNRADSKPLRLPALSDGLHAFTFANLTAYAVSPSGERTPTGNGFSCHGYFEITAATTSLKANAGGGFFGLACSIQ